MTILYVGGERRDAEAVAAALRGIAGNLTVSWTSRLDHAARWIDQNPDVAALVVESRIDPAGWRPVLERARSLPSQPLVAVIVPEGTGSQSESHTPGADEYVPKNQSLRELPLVVRRALDRTRVRPDGSASADAGAGSDAAQASRDREQLWLAERTAAAARHAQLQVLVDAERAARADLDQKLATASAALRDSEEQHRSEVAAAAEQLARQQAQYEIAMARAAAMWEMVDEQLREAAIKVERSRQDQVSAAADAERLARRESELSALLADTTAARTDLEQRLADAEAALEAARARAASDQRAAAEQFAERQRDLQRQLAEEGDRRRGTEEALSQAMRERDEAEKRRTVHVADAAAESRRLEAALSAARRDLETRSADVDRLAKREADLTSVIADATTQYNELQRRLAATEAAFQDATERATRERLAVARKAAEREAELDGEVRQERATRATVEQAAADAEAALRDARQQHEAALAASTRLLSERQVQFDRDLAQTTAARDSLAQRLIDAEVALDQVRREHEAAVADLDRLSREKTDLTSELRRLHDDRDGLALQLAEAVAARAALQQAVADTTAALRDAQQRHDAALARAAEDRAERQSEFDRQLSEAAAARDSVAQRLNDAEDVLEQVRRDHHAAAVENERLTRHAADVASQLADAQAARDRFERRLTEAVNALAAAEARAADLGSQLADTQAARDRFELRVTEAVNTLAAAEARAADLGSQLADAQAARDRLESRLTETVSALEQTEANAARERTAAEDRQADVEARLSKARGTCDTLERALAGMRASALDAQSVFKEEIERLRTTAQEDLARVEAQSVRERAAHDAQVAEERAAHDAQVAEERAAHLAQLADVRTAHEIRLAEMQDGSRRLTLERDALQESLDATEERLHQLDGTHRQACGRFEQELAASDANARRLSAECLEKERGLDAARREFQETLERLSNEHAAALAAMTATLAERDAELLAQAAQHAAARQAADTARAELQETFQNTLHERDRMIDQLQGTLAAATGTIEATKRRLDVLQAQADRLSPLQAQLDDSRAESHRLFHQASVAMFRCTREGALTEANRAWATLLRRKADELRGAEFAGAVFESPTDLRWLIEHCLSMRTKESIETTIRRKDGVRLFVRLSACSSSSDVIEIAAEDLTRVRVLQDRLGQAHRMEAVGRLASEVALTCDKLLDEVQQSARQWLADGAGSTAFRQQAETMLDDLGRASAHLERLVAYGDQQTRTATQVDLTTLLRDLAPVLKQVVGDDVEIHSTDPSSPLSVDAGAERVERLLVNLAAYGRERMPFGGRMLIEVGTSVVERQFTARYPNVRPGHHALITVTVARRQARTDGLLQLRDAATDRSARGTMGRKPGVDLGMLQGLVGECGGHLWMKVQPPGDLVAKIRLPLLTSYEPTHARALAAGSGRGRAIMRLFQH